MTLKINSFITVIQFSMQSRFIFFIPNPAEGIEMQLPLMKLKCNSHISGNCILIPTAYLTFCINIISFINEYNLQDLRAFWRPQNVWTHYTVVYYRGIWERLYVTAYMVLNQVYLKYFTLSWQSPGCEKRILCLILSFYILIQFNL